MWKYNGWDLKYQGSTTVSFPLKDGLKCGKFVRSQGNGDGPRDSKTKKKTQLLRRISGRD